MWSKSRLSQVKPSIEEVRKKSRVLVIDDQDFPAQANFERDGYHFERWPDVQNMSQLTDGHWDLLMIDIQGVGLAESPALQGLGILSHVKRANPAQPIIVYSAKRQVVSSSEYLVLADAVFDKKSTYLEYKERVDELLVRQATPGYFISVMNRELGEQAALVPKAVPKALRAFRKGKADGLERYLTAELNDEDKARILSHVVSIGIRAVAAVAA